jgi:hypothetical protein
MKYLASENIQINLRITCLSFRNRDSWPAYFGYVSAITLATRPKLMLDHNALARSPQRLCPRARSFLWSMYSARLILATESSFKVLKLMAGKAEGSEMAGIGI